MQIRNKLTGEIKDVNPSDLGTYGLGNTQTTAPTPAVTTPNTTTDYTDEQSKYQSGITKAEQAGDFKAATWLRTDFESKYGYKVFETPPEGTAARAEREKSQADADLLSKAQALKSTLDKGATGELTGKEYRDQLNFNASQMAASIGFTKGGKTLSTTELATLAGQMPNISPRGVSIVDKLKEAVTGFKPAQTGQIADDEATLRNKVKNTIQMLDKNADVKFAGEKDTTGTTGVPTVTTAGEQLNPNIVENVLNNAMDLAKSVPGLANTLAQLSPPAQALDVIQGDPYKQARILADMGKGLLQNLGETTGISYDNEGKFHWNAGDALVHDYNHPIDTALWILPFLKFGKGGILGQASEDAAKIGKGPELADIPKVASKTGVAGLTEEAARAATSIATPFPESVVKSEELMSKALQYTKSDTIRGMAKELETSIPTEGKVIDTWAKDMDATIGRQPVDSVIDEIMQEVNKTTSAKANPNLVNNLRIDLQNQLTDKEHVASTNYEAMNKARKYFGSGKDSWFNNGQPVGTPTNDLNAMEWGVANGIKKVMAEADTKGVVKGSLDRQHVAYETAPVLSKVALEKSGTAVSALSLKWSIIRKISNSLYQKIGEPLKIRRARALQPPISTTLPIIPQAPTGPLNLVPKTQTSLPATPGKIPLTTSDFTQELAPGITPGKYKSGTTLVPTGKGGFQKAVLSDIPKKKIGTDLPVIPQKVVDTAYDAMKKNGGITINLAGEQPKTGFAYSPYKGLETKVPTEKFTPEDVAKFVKKNWKTLSQKGNHFGGWEDGGNFYIDVSQVGPPNAQTLENAMKAKQLAAFDLESFSEIPLAKIDKGVYNRLYEATNHPYLNRGQVSGAGNQGGSASLPEIPASEGQSSPKTKSQVTSTGSIRPPAKSKSTSKTPEKRQK